MVFVIKVSQVFELRLGQVLGCFWLLKCFGFLFFFVGPISLRFQQVIWLKGLRPGQLMLCFQASGCWFF